MAVEAMIDAPKERLAHVPAASALLAVIEATLRDLQTGRAQLADFKGVLACGGFGYGDTLGAGIGWARSITFNEVLATQFKAFFGRDDTFGLGFVVVRVAVNNQAPAHDVADTAADCDGAGLKAELRDSAGVGLEVWQIAGMVHAHARVAMQCT